LKSNLVQVVVETPRAAAINTRFDERTGRMKLSKVMPEGWYFHMIAFLPETRGEDGAPSLFSFSVTETTSGVTMTPALWVRFWQISEVLGKGDEK